MTITGDVSASRASLLDQGQSGLSRASQTGMRNARRTRLVARTAIVAALILIVLGGLSLWGISRVGQWLVVEDPLERATAIVVLGGHVPFRAMEAAAIYGEKWAPEVWLARPASGPEQAVLDRLGLDIEVGDNSMNRAVLERLGVPPGAIRVLSPGVQNTSEEMRLVAREMARVAGDRVILVTSKPHSRRVRATWRALVGSAPQAVVRYAESDAFDGHRWWERTGDALAVSREVFGLINVWAGFPVRPYTKALSNHQRR
jgi:uncharacterized SAM-binding protein YcdF (DUF218 family)